MNGGRYRGGNWRSGLSTRFAVTPLSGTAAKVLLHIDIPGQPYALLYGPAPLGRKVDQNGFVV
jgi:hypothetical protein